MLPKEQRLSFKMLSLGNCCQWVLGEVSLRVAAKEILSQALDVIDLNQTKTLIAGYRTH